MLQNRNLPEWMKILADEFTRPPYFLEHLAQGNPSKTLHHDTSANSHKTRPPLYETSAKNHSTDKIHHAHVSVADDKIQSSSFWQGSFQKADFPVNLPDVYGWTIQKAWRHQDLMKVLTSTGTFALKKTSLTPQRVMFIDKVLSHIEASGFHRTVKFARTKKLSRPYVLRQGDTYYATEWTPGAHLNLANLQQLSAAARALANFYENSRGFQPEGYHPPYEYELATIARRRLDDLQQLVAEVNKKSNPDSFDRTFLKLSSTLISDAEQSIRLLSTKSVRDALLAEQKGSGVCHLDVIPGNMMFDGKEVILLDFDLSTYAPRALDIAHLLRRSLQQMNWNSEPAYHTFVEYDSVRPLQTSDYLMIQGLLRFPYRAWRLAHTRYRLFADDAQIEELKTYASQEERRQAFMDSFSKQIHTEEEKQI